MIGSVMEEDEIDLLQRLLSFSPSLRIGVEDALAHPFLLEFHDCDDEPTWPQFVESSFPPPPDMNAAKHYSGTRAGLVFFIHFKSSPIPLSQVRPIYIPDLLQRVVASNRSGS